MNACYRPKADIRKQPLAANSGRSHQAPIRPDEPADGVNGRSDVAKKTVKVDDDQMP